MLACVKQRYARHLASGKIDAWNTSAMKISSIEKGFVLQKQNCSANRRNTYSYSNTNFFVSIHVE